MKSLFSARLFYIGYRAPVSPHVLFHVSRIAEMKAVSTELVAAKNATATLEPPAEGVMSRARPKNKGADNAGNDKAIGVSVNDDTRVIASGYPSSPAGKPGRGKSGGEHNTSGFPDSQGDSAREMGGVDGELDDGGCVEGYAGGSGGGTRRQQQQQPSGPQHGYASLRKIREHTPLPTVRP